MNDTLFALVSDYGVVALALSCFLSCLLVPIPTSFLMLAGGAFVASDDLVAWQVITAAFCGAVLGDQTGYWIGRLSGDRLGRALGGRPQRARILARARAYVDRHGSPGVFFSTWAIAPLGPYVNFIAGATGLKWLRFTLSDAAGELIWVTGYTSLGYAFAANLTLIAQIAAQASGFLAAITVTAGLFALIVRRIRNSGSTDET